MLVTIFSAKDVLVAQPILVAVHSEALNCWDELPVN